MRDSLFPADRLIPSQALQECHSERGEESAFAVSLSAFA
jgi:hypothetical protein